MVLDTLAGHQVITLAVGATTIMKPLLPGLYLVLIVVTTGLSASLVMMAIPSTVMVALLLVPLKQDTLAPQTILKDQRVHQFVLEGVEMVLVFLQTLASAIPDGLELNVILSWFLEQQHVVADNIADGADVMPCMALDTLAEHQVITHAVGEITTMKPLQPGLHLVLIVEIIVLNASLVMTVTLLMEMVALPLAPLNQDILAQLIILKDQHVHQFALEGVVMVLACLQTLASAMQDG